MGLLVEKCDFGIFQNGSHCHISASEKKTLQNKTTRSQWVTPGVCQCVSHIPIFDSIENISITMSKRLYIYFTKPAAQTTRGPKNEYSGLNPTHI